MEIIPNSIITKQLDHNKNSDNLNYVTTNANKNNGKITKYSNFKTIDDESLPVKKYLDTEDVNGTNKVTIKQESKVNNLKRKKADAKLNSSSTKSVKGEDRQFFIFIILFFLYFKK